MLFPEITRTCNGRREIVAVFGLGVKHDVCGRNCEVTAQRVHEVNKAAGRGEELILRDMGNQDVGDGDGSRKELFIETIFL